MSVCRFIASDIPLTIYEPPQEYPFHVNIDEGIIDDGGADDNYFLLDFPDVDLYTNKEYGVSLEWEYTDGRAKQIIEYIKNALLENIDRFNREPVDLWNDEYDWLNDDTNAMEL